MPSQFYKLDEGYKTIDSIIDFIEEEAKRKLDGGNIAFLKVRRIYRTYKKKFPESDIHPNHVCIAFAILHKSGKIERMKNFPKVWIWQNNGEVRNAK